VRTLKKTKNSKNSKKSIKNKKSIESKKNIKSIENMLFFYKKTYNVIRESPGISMRSLSSILKVSPQFVGQACAFLWGRKLIRPYTSSNKSKRYRVFHWVANERENEYNYDKEYLEPTIIEEDNEEELDGEETEETENDERVEETEKTDKKEDDDYES